MCTYLWHCTTSEAWIRDVGGDKNHKAVSVHSVTILHGIIHLYVERFTAKDETVPGVYKNPHVGYKIPLKSSEEEGHRAETPSRGSGRYYRWEAASCVRLVEFFSPHSSVRSLSESQQWSPDGAAPAGLIHVLLLLQAAGWRNEEVKGHSHQDNHHNSDVCRADKWLMTAINPTQEGKRLLYICSWGEWCFALQKLEVRGDNAPYVLMEKTDHHCRQFSMYWPLWAPNQWKVLYGRGWMDCCETPFIFLNAAEVLLGTVTLHIQNKTVDKTKCTVKQRRQKKASDDQELLLISLSMATQ